MNINYFYNKDENGEATLKQRCQPITVDKLKRLVEQGKDITLHVPLCAETLNWEKYDEYQDALEKYNADLLVVEAHNNKPRNSNDDVVELLVEPTKPVLEFEPVTDDYVKGLIAGSQWQQQRINGYGSIEDQLDMIYHNGLDAWQEHIKTVKENNPKS